MYTLEILKIFSHLLPEKNRNAKTENQSEHSTHKCNHE